MGNIKTTSGKIAPLIILFLSLPFLGHTQDCCGPGGGGGGSQFNSSEYDDSGSHYRLKGVRHYAYSARHQGFTTGLESAGFTDKSQTSFTPRLEYFTSLQANEQNNFDIYGAAFYTVFLDAPHSHQVDISENIAWRFAITENSRLVLRIDNEDLFVIFPNESGIKYAVIDPSIGYIAALDFGDISFNAGFPVSIEPETGFSSWACLGYEHPIGLGVSLCPRFTLFPDPSYAGTTLTLTFAWDSFFAKAALLADKDFTVFQIRPYAEYTLKHCVFWAGVELGGIGEGEFSASPFIGFGYNF
ncbi:MAG: hypothetical protein LBV17_10600 [Treponema sp.]|jgi:hypothetical protein|nr:hypothetical protein [Treponema sp.]